MKNRKDNKKRNLRPGEYQRADGRYEYRYRDEEGISRSVYSNRLVPTDIGDDVPLRELESEIVRGERRVTKKRTFDEAFTDYILSAPCRDHVRSWKKYWYELHIKDRLGDKDISKLTNADIQRFYRHMGVDLGYSASYLEEMHSIINGVFRNELSCRRIQSNPAENLGKTLKFMSPKQVSERRAMTPDEQEAFLLALDRADIADNVRYLLRFLLGTGCRISEALSLRWSDVNFAGETIRVDHSFVTVRDETGRYDRYLSETKTESGRRAIPMIQSIKEMLTEMSGRSESEFIFVNQSGIPYTRGNIDIMLRRIREKYNGGVYGYLGNVSELPVLSAHILRHTFCTRLCENVTDMSGLKNVADIMGHASVNMTLNVYTSVDGNKKKEVMQQAEKKLLI